MTKNIFKVSQEQLKNKRRVMDTLNGYIDEINRKNLQRYNEEFLVGHANFFSFCFNLFEGQYWGEFDFDWNDELNVENTKSRKVERLP